MAETNHCYFITLLLPVEGKAVFLEDIGFAMSLLLAETIRQQKYLIQEILIKYTGNQYRLYISHKNLRNTVYEKSVNPKVND